MHLSSLVEMVESGFDERVLLGTRDAPVTGAELGRLVRAGASTLGGHKALVYVGENHPRLPVALFSAAWAGIPFVPVNYRLEDHQLNSLIGRQPVRSCCRTRRRRRRITGDAPVAVFDEWLGSLPDDPPAADPPFDDDERRGRPVHERHDVGTEVGAAAASALDGVPAGVGRVRRRR